MTRRRRPLVSDAPRVASYPHPYPEGWYRLAASASLRRGETRYIECLGGQFVLRREQDSDRVHLMDAFCPHLGSNLALGRVRGDCLECPFHGWQFDSSGRVRHIPYSEYPPKGVLTGPLPVQEVHGQIFAYHRHDRSAYGDDLPPPYDVPRIAEVDDGRFVYRGHHDGGRVRMHIMEFAENVADAAHFQPLHGQFRIPWTQIPVPGVQIEHSTDWKLDDERPWAMHLLDEAVLNLFGRRIEQATVQARVSFWGPGGVIIFRLSLPEVGEIAMYQTLLPVGPLEQQVDFHWFADRHAPRLLVSGAIGGWVSSWQQDIEIWENKTYRSRPVLCRDDGPVHAVRRWYRQFLPESVDPADSHAEPNPRD